MYAPCWCRNPSRTGDVGAGSVRRSPRGRTYKNVPARRYSGMHPPTLKSIFQHNNNIEEHEAKFFHTLGTPKGSLFIGGEQGYFWDDKYLNEFGEK